LSRIGFDPWEIAAVRGDRLVAAAVGGVLGAFGGTVVVPGRFREHINYTQHHRIAAVAVALADLADAGRRIPFLGEGGA
jgi:hypothetical protein